MKKLLVSVVVLIVATNAMAQVLMVGQTAEPVEQGSLDSGVSVLWGLGDSEAKIIAARGTFGVMDDLVLVGDIGCEFEGDVLAIAIAGQYALPFDFDDVDLAARLGYSVFDLEFKDMGSVYGLVVASTSLEQIDGLAVFGGFGFTYSLFDDADVEMLGTLGATWDIPVDDLTAAVELSYMAESPAVSCGVRLAL